MLERFWFDGRSGQKSNKFVGSRVWRAGGDMVIGVGEKKASLEILDFGPLFDLL